MIQTKIFSFLFFFFFRFSLTSKCVLDIATKYPCLVYEKTMFKMISYHFVIVFLLCFSLLFLLLWILFYVCILFLYFASKRSFSLKTKILFVVVFLRSPASHLCITKIYDKSFNFTLFLSLFNVEKGNYMILDWI